MRATRFPARAAGPAERLTGFIAHLRMNGVTAGPAETSDAMQALGHVAATDPAEARLALKTLLAGDADGWARFDALFDGYWFNAGRERAGTARADHVRRQAAKPMLWQPHFDEPDGPAGDGEATPDQGTGEGDAEGTDGRLIATRSANLAKRDLREVMDAAPRRAPPPAAGRLARALVDRRSRRQKIAAKGRQLAMRRVLRASLRRGGEPVDLYRRHRPERPLRIVALCDVSGSMTVYARVFLAFVKGLVGADLSTDAYLFHTRLMRVTEALRDGDSLRAAGRLSLMAEGFGGGTDIAGAIGSWCDGHARAGSGRRTVVVVLSDGCCTSAPAALGAALAQMRRRVRRIVWLNPLKGWRDYAPVAGGIAAALPHLDAHLPANTVEALAALEPEFARL